MLSVGVVVGMGQTVRPLGVAIGMGQTVCPLGVAVLGG